MTKQNSERQRNSVQWFSWNILIGLCGAAFIGGAVFASLDGDLTFAKVQDRFVSGESAAKIQEKASGYVDRLARDAGLNKEGSFQSVYKQLLALSGEELDVLGFTENPCVGNIDCGGLKPDQVKSIVEVAIKRKEKLETAGISKTANFVAALSLCVAVGALLISGATFFLQLKRNEL
ncbi:MAG: peptidase [Spartobacteria bacterium]|nr:peptidase [Spartobacteria bacterium]